LIGLENDAVKLIVDGTEVSVDLRNVDAARLKPMVLGEAGLEEI